MKFMRDGRTMTKFFFLLVERLYLFFLFHINPPLLSCSIHSLLPPTLLPAHFSTFIKRPITITHPTSLVHIHIYGQSSKISWNELSNL